MKVQFSDWPLNADDTVVVKLLSGACTEMGYCLSEEDNERIRASSFETIGEFAAQVMMAEGLSPEMNKYLFRALCAWIRDMRPKFGR
ncbi:hypothetical protein GCM10007385_42750 [Tateyamaria omphalii]|uniref:hypothetical protein n=1 Tax=Tateyamaria omphalii TaxID=299262 RepID=UPI0016735989|nr:hypothetical protein [Tateyamaria omphalii]GGX68965.1 hypothetical protein GCM10007385_42750 [Tateyamaria omphalii]